MCSLPPYRRVSYQIRYEGNVTGTVCAPVMYCTVCVCLWTVCGMGVRVGVRGVSGSVRMWI